MIIGRAGRVPPNVQVISPDEIDPPINLQAPGDAARNPFDPASDGIDFYESVEGMRVTVADPVAVSGTRTFSPFSSEVFVLADHGLDVAPRDARTRRGGINLQPDPDNRDDQNPERVQIQFYADLFPAPVPALKVGDRLGDVTGVVGYSFGNFELNATEVFPISPKPLRREHTRLQPRPSKLTVASYNVLNLNPLADDDNQRARLAEQIARHLAGPDIVALQEIQDNDGETGGAASPITDASKTLHVLVDAIAAAGGPAYAFFDVAPPANTSGGAPGSNIRNAFLYNPERVSLNAFKSLTADRLAAAGVSHPDAFAGTRDPLAATFLFNGETLRVINNHLTSRFGSTPVFGVVQPGEVAREAQAQALHEYVRWLVGQDPDAKIVMPGNLNTFEFTDDLRLSRYKHGEVGKLPAPSLIKHRIPHNVRVMRRRRDTGQPEGAVARGQLREAAGV